MSYVKVYVHFIWSTKNRKPLLTDDIRGDVFNHILENAKKRISISILLMGMSNMCIVWYL